MTLPYSPLALSSATERVWGGEGTTEAAPTPIQGPRRAKTRDMDALKKPKDFIVLSEFSEQVGPVPVVRVYSAELLFMWLYM